MDLPQVDGDNLKPITVDEVSMILLQGPFLECRNPATCFVLSSATLL